jgi:hypothetical protein
MTHHLMTRISKVLEKKIERRASRMIRSAGFSAIKFEDPARRGAPDRIVLLPRGRCLFIEFKRPGETLREEQRAYHAMLREMDHAVIVCTSAHDALAATLMHNRIGLAL